MTSYALACPIPVGSRYFTAEADRDAFIAASLGRSLQP
jgi:hypothetical protein